MGDLINTFTLVLVSSFVSIVIGIPLGIWMAKNNTVKQVINPILDFMQTMPAFVYLIPAVAFFGIGIVPGYLLLLFSLCLQLFALPILLFVKFRQSWLKQQTLSAAHLDKNYSKLSCL